MRINSMLGHGAKAVLKGAVLAVLVASLFAGTAVAAGKGKPGGGSGGGTLTLVMVVDANTNGAPNYGDTVTFTTTSTASYPMAGLRCYQGSTYVFDGYVSLYSSWLSKLLVLASSQWNPSASASCTARLFTYDSRSREQVITTLSFTVAP